MKKNLIFVILIFLSQNCFAQSFQSFYPSSDASGVSFGADVDVFENEVLVSSQTSIFINSPSKVYLFNLTGLGLQQTNVFHPSDVLQDDNFGNSISIHNGFIAIGSPLHDGNLTNSGAVYVYKKTNGAYLLQQKITAPNFSLNANFGSFVKIFNNQLFISASGTEPSGLDVNTNNGSVYVYSYNGTNWVFSKELTISDSKNFGKKIEIENNKLVISSDGGYTTGSKFSLHTYNWESSQWIFANSINVGNLERSISDFSLSNNQVFLISTVLNFNNEVLILSQNNGTWDTANPSSVAIASNGRVFFNIKVKEDKMFLGDSFSVLQIQEKSPVLFYEKINSTWVFRTSFYGSGSSGNDDSFGKSLVTDGTTVIIGAPQEGVVLPGGKAYYANVANLGNEIFERKIFSVYPNPTSNHTINIESETPLDEIQLLTINGQLIQVIKNPVIKNQTYTLENLPSGFYLLKLISKNHSVTKKIIVD